MNHYPPHLLHLLELFKKFPGIGAKTAERLVFTLMTWPEDKQKQFAEAILQTKQKITHCTTCGALIGEGSCLFCDTSKRDSNVLCVVAFAKDLFLIDQTRQYRGLYHVLGGVISPMEQITLSSRVLERLKERLVQHHVKEIILALDSTIEGDATALYIKKELNGLNLPISRLAFGLPMGSSLDFIDGGTLSRALQGRLTF
ncbi:MAG: recombination protein RecR [Verrucomicrobia bacterium]|nr:recombination protein RecR [Verrucomicrobiota bacterium]MBS0647075.1 recombination protein RecR [Verrucomicrobiota bacterium]